MEQPTETTKPNQEKQTGLRVRTQVRVGEDFGYEECMEGCLPHLKSWPACWKACDGFIEE